VIEVPTLADSSIYAIATTGVQDWIEKREYAGFEPYDLLNSPYLQRDWIRNRFLAAFVIQVGRRWGGLTLRKLLHIPPSLNPKALSLCLLAYCDLQQLGYECRSRIDAVKEWLVKLRSINQEYYCWGYDWDFVSLRGSTLPKFQPNCIATYFCARALHQVGLIFGDSQATAMAASACEFLVRTLKRSVETDNWVCFSYTPTDCTRIYNNSALAGALMAQLAIGTKRDEYLSLSRRSMRYLADHQRTDGSWTYGDARSQQWIDGFHSAYNLCALLDYRSATSDTSFDQAIHKGYEFYKQEFIRKDGAPNYSVSSRYPIDVHSCSQAILTFCRFEAIDPQALSFAERTARWTIQHMQSADGAFFYQIRRLRVDRTPYMRWGQAWMFHALSRLQLALAR
jgi:hypothetical protein